MNRKNMPWLIMIIVWLGLITACTPTEQATATAVSLPPILDGTEWVLVSLNGRSPLPESHLTLQFSEGEVTGNSGCNWYNGAYTVTPQSNLTIPEIASTTRDCPEIEGVLAQEAAFQEALWTVAGYQLQADQLAISNAEGKTTLVFEPKAQIEMLLETAVSSPTIPPEISIETSYALLPPDEMIGTADAIYSGRITAISPTQFNQDSDLGSTQTALPIFTVEMTVDEVFVDDIGLAETAVLTQVGNSPLAQDSDWSLRVGDEIIAFVVQRRALRFSNAPADTYLLRQANGRYASLPTAANPWPPMTEAEMAHRLAEIRPVLMEDGVSLRITTPEPSPTPAVCTPLPEGMALTVTPLTDTKVSLELTGLSPGESLYIIYRWDGIDGSTQIEDYDLPPVGENGRYTQTQNLQSPEAESRIWQIKVIHRRGVACTEITLPPPPKS